MDQWPEKSGCSGVDLLYKAKITTENALKSCFTYDTWDFTFDTEIHKRTETFWGEQLLLSALPSRKNWPHSLNYFPSTLLLFPSVCWTPVNFLLVGCHRFMCTWAATRDSLLHLYKYGPQFSLNWVGRARRHSVIVSGRGWKHKLQHSLVGQVTWQGCSEAQSCQLMPWGMWAQESTLFNYYFTKEKFKFFPNLLKCW